MFMMMQAENITIYNSCTDVGQQTMKIPILVGYLCGQIGTN